MKRLLFPAGVMAALVFARDTTAGRRECNAATTSAASLAAVGRTQDPQEKLTPPYEVLMRWGPTDLSGVDAARFDAANKWDVNQLVSVLTTTDSWPQVFLAALAARHQPDDKREGLTNRLLELFVDTRSIPLKETSRLIIWKRIVSGEIFFESAGLILDDDLFLVAARANWTLRMMTSQDFGHIEVDTDQKAREQLRDRWRQSLRGEPVAACKEHISSDRKKSKDGLHAMILSLTPSKQKTEYTNQKLKTLYKLDAMPARDDPNFKQASLCNPDTLAHNYIYQLTGIAKALEGTERETDEQVARWWREWWDEHHATLMWDADKWQKLESYPAQEGRFVSARDPETKAKFLQFVEKLKDDPLNDDAARLMAFVTTFAEASNEVSVVIRPEFMPWFDGVEGAFRSLALGHYIVGSAAAQIRTGKKSHNLLASWQQVLRLYQAAKDKGLAVDSSELDKFLQLHKHDKLAEHAREVARRAEQKPN